MHFGWWQLKNSMITSVNRSYFSAMNNISKPGRLIGEQ